MADQRFSDLNIGVTGIAKFTHNGDPYRIKFYKLNVYKMWMTAYSGHDGPTTVRNRVDRVCAWCDGCTLRQCFEIAAANRFEIKVDNLEIQFD